MIYIRRSEERGQADFGWLKARYSFSFANYHDPRFMGFRSLRVINQDRVAPGHGFPEHGHRDMEIITFVIEGQLEHRDSLGHGSIIKPGQIQRMSAGRGIRHSEFNPSDSQELQLLQIWIEPSARNFPPSYEQQDVGSVPDAGLKLLASPDGRDQSVTIHQDALLMLGKPGAGQSLQYALAPGRHAWLQMIAGEVELDGHVLQAGDAAAISEENALNLKARSNSELLLFDLA